MVVDGTEGYPSREDRIVAEFGDGHDVEGIAFRYGLTVEQVYAVIEREVGPADQAPPSPYPPPDYYYGPPPAAQYYAPPPGPQGYYAPPPGQPYYPPPPGQAYYAPPGYPPPAAYAPPGQGFPPPPQVLLDEDAVVAEYGEGYDVAWIAHKHGISVERVYEVVQRVVGNDTPPPSGPTP